ncbi:MAG: potassium channel family protein [Flavobacteriales bacterium]
MNHEPLKIKTRFLAIALCLIFIVGTLGYINISDYSFVDALYMTVITVTTVGFGEIHPLTEEGRIFTMFLVLTSLGLVAYSASTIGKALLDGDLMKKYKENRMNKQLKMLKNHTIICGFGRNGRQAARKLKSSNHPFLVIEKDKERIIADHNDVVSTVIEGDAIQDHILKKAMIKEADSLIATLPSDADNLFIVLTAKQLNPKVKVISRASSHQSVKKLKIAGADHVIMPDKIGGEHMASLIVTPGVLEFLDNLSVEGSYQNNIVEVYAEDFPKEFLGKSILDLDLRKKSGVSVIGYKTPQGEYFVNPDVTTQVVEKSSFIILGQPGQITALKEVFSIK